MPENTLAGLEQEQPGSPLPIPDLFNMYIDSLASRLFEVIRRSTERLSGHLFFDYCLLHSYSTGALRRALKICQQWKNGSSMIWSVPKYRDQLPRTHRLRTAFTTLKLNEQRTKFADTVPYLAVELTKRDIRNGTALKQIKKETSDWNVATGKTHVALDDTASSDSDLLHLCEPAQLTMR